jgi:hypothetical protein|tara:strand:+ start:65 stop:295 length:231 start_codon:yes stop_codon:yes gene_type:complete
MVYDEILNPDEYIQKIESIINKSLNDNDKILIRNLNCSFNLEEKAIYHCFFTNEQGIEVHHPMGITEYTRIEGENI